MSPSRASDTPPSSGPVFDGRERRATPAVGVARATAEAQPPVDPALARRHARQLALLRGVATQLSHTATPRAVAELLIHTLADAYGASWVALYRANPDGTFSRRVEHPAGTPAAPERIEGPAVTRFHYAPDTPVLRGTSPADADAAAVREGGVRDGDTTREGGPDPASLLGAEMAAPVDDQGSRLGWFAVGARADGAAYDDTDLRFLALLAHFAAPRLAYADLAAAYRHAALIDEPTGLGNRRAFEERIDEELARSNRSGQPMSLVLCEIDALAALVARHGAAARDRTLGAVADVISQSVRRSDMAFRYSDVRFALIITNTDAAGARIAAERLRRGVAALMPPGASEPLTCSVGIGVLRGVHKPLSLATLALYRKADEALYRAASAGGDRCVVG
ncbi:MAG: GGDEF domain-containing protein [Gemmatimonadaceae bacterium]